MNFDAEVLRNVVKSGGVGHRENALSFIFDCPACGKASKLYIRKSTGRCRCFACGVDSGLDGRCEKALVKLYGYTFNHWCEVLRDSQAPMGYMDVEFRDPWTEDDEIVVGERTFFGWEWPPDAVPCAEDGGAKGMAYLNSRGLAAGIVTAHDIRYIARENRVCFPFYIGGTLVGWQKRICGPDKRYDPVTGNTYRIPKALTETEAGVASQYVMFGDGIEAAGHCVLTEGPISALKAYLCGGHVATLGKGMVSDAQVAWIAKRVPRVYIGFDPDAATAIQKVIGQFAAQGTETFLLMPPGNGAWEEDLGACEPEQVLEQFKKAPRVSRNNMMLSFGCTLAF